MNTKQIGNVGVAQAIAHYTGAGCEILLPIGDSTRYDLIVDHAGDLARVQVKTVSTQRTPFGVPVVTLSTQGGNQSWNHQHKLITEAECDLVFVHVMGVGNWEFPVAHVAGKKSLNLGDKQEEFRLKGVELRD